MIQRAEGQTQRLLNFASDLLVLSRAREARLFTERKPIDLLEIVQKVVTHYKPRLEAKSITLSVQFLEQPPCLYADPEALEQVVMNLVGNAVVYTLEGGRVDVKVDESATRLASW